MDRIESLEGEIAEIRKTLHAKEQELYALKKEWYPLVRNHSAGGTTDQQQVCKNNGQVQLQRLPRWAIERYSRQILLQEVGVRGQERICDAKVLIVGAGGLGCPAAIYLAAAGVGEIGIVDYDAVDLTNIHRQILHGERDEHMSKAESAADTLRSINSKITVTPYNVQLDSSNALAIVGKYDIVLDCSDNVPTRYLLNDVCVLSKLPLISGSALKMEGQITTYGYRAEKNPNEKDPTYVGPCYRCVFPTPPPAETVGSCSANGVAGPVPAVIGSLQALEAIKYIVGQPRQKLLVGRLLLFDGDDMIFRNVKLRPQNPECAACSEHATVTQLLDYETFCKAQAKEKKRQEARLRNRRRQEEKERRKTGQSYLGYRSERGHSLTWRRWFQDVPKDGRKIGPRCRRFTSRPFCFHVDLPNRTFCEKTFCYGAKNDLELHILPPNHRVTPTELAENMNVGVAADDDQRHLLVDVRSEPEFGMCRIDGAVNYPIDSLRSDRLDDLLQRIRECANKVIFICRRGNDSQVAAQRVLDTIEGEHRDKVADLEGGLHAWARVVDSQFPVY